MNYVSRLDSIMMNNIPERTFKSYIDESELENVPLNDRQKTQFLEGETLIQEAQNVLLYAPLRDRSKCSIGVLTVTTFKLSFASANDTDSDTNELWQTNQLLRPNEICLSCIESIYQLTEKSKKKKLVPGQNVTGKIKELLIVCKNMRVLHFSFKQSENDKGKQVAAALLHHAFPKRHQLLFAYDFREPHVKSMVKEARLYTTEEEWRKELERTKCPNWRVTDVNKNYQTSPNLPQYIVVPHSIMNSFIQQAAGHFRSEGFPVWVWGNETASLVRMPELQATITESTFENTYFANVHKTHPKQLQPQIFDLTKECPSPKEVQSSYHKLSCLCTPDTARLFKEQDFKFYGLLDQSKWLQFVSTCLSKAKEGAELLLKGTTVVLQEDRGQDMNCVISSLIQLMVDAHWRTRKGFQSLIQKEWVSLGHPFANRLGHILNADIEPSYLFLLFLDCVWQLLEQFPAAFQFSETFLTTVWDSSHLTLFDTFLFNCEHDRRVAAISTPPLILRSVWDWAEQFPESELVLFNNPLYKRHSREPLSPCCRVSSLGIWRQCYFRWLPDLEIMNGGKPQIDLCNRFLAEEIDFLKHKLQNSDVNGVVDFSETKEEKLAILKKVHSFYPFSHRGPNVWGAIDNGLLSGDVIETQSILNLTND